jgi:ABC-type Fe3+/spermidine/putrescine transport system ATPase subunit
VSIRPEDMGSQAITDGSKTNTVQGVVDLSIFAGSIVEAEIKCNNRIVQCTFGREENINKGEQKSLHFRADDVVVLLADKTLRGEDPGVVPH